jgi:hypothetical protein
MKQLHFICILILCAASACKKVDNELAEQEGMPSVNTGQITVYLPGGIGSVTAGYPREVLVGDTITLAGRLHVKEGASMSLGNAQVQYTYTTEWQFKDYASGTITNMDLVRFVVTEEMGSGPQPLVIRNGSFVRTAPDITIHTVPDIASSTDTTLVVTEIMGQDIPGFIARYNTNGQVNPTSPGWIFEGCSITGNGEIWLQSRIDIYRVRNGQVESFLKTGDALTINGQSITATEFLGMTVNSEGTAIYLSIGNRINSTTGRYYLLKMDIASRQTALANTTFYRLRDASSAQIVETSPFRFMNTAAVTDVPLKASGLRIDSLGRLLFNNIISIDNNSVNNLVRVNENGRMNVLLEYQGSSDRLKYKRLLAISPNGRYAYVVPSTDGIMCYDLELEEIVAKADGTQGLFQVSFEQKGEYRFADPLRPFEYQENSSHMVLNNGKLLQAKGVSLGAIDLRTTSVYAYAGLERGYSTYSRDQLAVQKNVTGQARYVSFESVLLLGIDAAGNCYFMRGGIKNNQGVTGPKIYRLSKP